jgi:hypothetical protein
MCGFEILIYKHRKTPLHFDIKIPCTDHFDCTGRPNIKEQAKLLYYVVTGIQNNLFSEKGQTYPLKWQNPVKADGSLLPKGRSYPLYSLF